MERFAVRLPTPLPNFESSARGGCRLCGFLWRAITDEFRLRPIDMDVLIPPGTAWDGKVKFKSQRIRATGGRGSDSDWSSRLNVTFSWTYLTQQVPDPTLH